MHLSDLQLCLLTHAPDRSFKQYRPFLQQAIAGGVTSVQFRLKNASPKQQFRFAQPLRDFLADHRIPLVINDNLALCIALEAEGLHLGQQDTHPLTARDALSDSTWIGWSIETLNQLTLANELSCLNYVAASAIFPSSTKLNCTTYWGLAGLQHVVQLSRHPVVAIGGINSHNAADVLQKGACGIAVIGALHQADNPFEEAMILRAHSHLSPHATSRGLTAGSRSMN